MLTEKAKQLIPKAKIFSVATIEDIHSDEIISIFQIADKEGKYLTDENIDFIKNKLPQLENNLSQSKILRDNANDIVEKARQEVLKCFPQITQPGGDLYPNIRAEACWRDFWHFLRCISYAVAGDISCFTNADGLVNMELLYQELKVPLSAMVVGLQNLKVYSLNYFSAEEIENITIYFDHLITQMQNFKND